MAENNYKFGTSQEVDKNTDKKDDDNLSKSQQIRTDNLLKLEVEQMNNQDKILKINHIATQIGLEESLNDVKPSPMLGDSKYRSVFGGEGFLPHDAFVYPLSCTRYRASYNRIQHNSDDYYLRSGPRRHLYFKPDEVKACIVTCGGLCPGLNVVIREVVMALWFSYKVRTIWGIKYGYKGFYSHDWEELNPKSVSNIHKQGGTILGSSRGGFDAEKIIKAVQEHGCNMIIGIGGDGTHRALDQLQKVIVRDKLKIVIGGVPKTIDNDIPIIDKSFGYTTSVAEATKAIESAEVEALAAENGIGLVKVMGRSAGHIALGATQSHRSVNVCQIPEFKIDLYGEYGLYSYLQKRLEQRGHCVIIVAEGMGDSIEDISFDKNLGTDASGNVKMPDVGLYLKKEIPAYFKKLGTDVTLKYIDPTYMIRTVPANPDDVDICAQLAFGVVHGLMAGFTGFTTGKINDKTSYIPFSKLGSEPINVVTRNSRTYHRMLQNTGQPSFVNKRDEKADVCLVNLETEHRKISDVDFFKQLSMEKKFHQQESQLLQKPLISNISPKKEIVDLVKDKNLDKNSKKYIDIKLSTIQNIVVPIGTAVQGLFWLINRKNNK